MDLRLFYSIILSILVMILIVCVVKSFRSNKPIGKSLGKLLIAFIIPITGNMIIIISGNKNVSIIGYFMYFIGMNYVMFNQVRFTNVYCKGIGNGRKYKPTIIYVFLLADTIQLLLNPVFGHAFDVEKIEVQGLPYYRLIPHFGQTVHRLVDYSVYMCVLIIFTIAAKKTAKIYRERYTVIIVAMLILGVWQAFYIFSRTPIDRSMIGYGVVGIMVFYLSIYYRPLRLLDRMLSNIASDLPDALYVFDPMGKCIWANDPGLKMVDVVENELEAVPKKIYERFGVNALSEDEWGENKVIGDGDDARYYSIQKHTVRYDRKYLAGSFVSIHDNTEEQRKVQQEIYNSTHDSLTGLFTKQYLYEQIQRRLNSDDDTDYYVVFVDVKNFKIVNDIFGTNFGDLAIQQIASWIRSRVTDNSIYGRLAGDTFGVFRPALGFNPDKLEEDLGNFIVSDGTVEYHLQMNLGVYEVADWNTEISVMFDRAHLALSSLKDNYKSHVAFYDTKLREKVVWEQKLTAELKDALASMQIKPYLQPIADGNGKVVGAEALVRWIHPDNGFMSPAMFVPLYEKNGMIVEIDKHMWRCACRILSEWKGRYDDLFISINISPKDFYFIDVVSELTGLVKEFDIEPVKLRLEITETVMMNASEKRMKILDELRKAGFIVEMDDFGSGYSSLNLLKDMPVDVLKIDMRFLSGSENDEKSNTIIRNIIRLSEELNIATLTEGVETDKQFSQLSDMGCKLFQGYYFAKPMPVDEFVKFADTHGMQ